MRISLRALRRINANLQRQRTEIPSARSRKLRKKKERKKKGKRKKKKRKEEGRKSRERYRRVTFSLRISLPGTKIDTRALDGGINYFKRKRRISAEESTARARPLLTHTCTRDALARARARTRIDIRAMLRLLMRVFEGSVVAV